MTDYSKMTQEDFDTILVELLQAEPHAGVLLHIPGIYEIVAEEYNNAVLDEWKRRQESK